MKRNGLFHILTIAAAFAVVVLFAATSFAASNGWIKKGDATYYYKNGRAVTGLQTLKRDGLTSTYYFDKKGVMKTGLVRVSGRYYFFDEAGRAQCGWQKINGNRYYFGKDNYKAFTGLKKIGNARYYFNNSGKLRTGWVDINESRYYFSKESAVFGQAATGLKKIGKYYYHFTVNGKLQKGLFKTVNANRYYFSENKGRAVTGLAAIKGADYLFDKDGRLLINKAKLEYGGKLYKTDSKGIATPLIKTKVGLNHAWKYAGESVINSGSAWLYYAQSDRKNITVGINAGHGTSGVGSAKTWCHPDHSPKVTGGTTAAGALKAIAVSSGMSFTDGSSEAGATLKVAQYLRDILLKKGYDVLMIRDGSDIQLDNVARTVICNNMADCHISIHYDSDGLGYDKGVYFMSVPDGLKKMQPVASHWKKHEALGKALVSGLKDNGYKVWGDGSMDMDLTQTSYSTVPSVDIELGNQHTPHGNTACNNAAKALAAGVDKYFLK